jgi:hypothetical protein
MARERDDDPRPARARRRDPDDDYEAEDDRPRRRRDEEYDDEDDRPRRRRRPSDEADSTGGLIPYKNGKALAAYYCGVFALIPCVGLILGPIALILGIMGLQYAKEHPRARGQAHAIVGIVLGGLVLLAHVGGILVMIIGAAASK